MIYIQGVPKIPLIWKYVGVNENWETRGQEIRKRPLSVQMIVFEVGKRAVREGNFKI